MEFQGEQQKILASLGITQQTVAQHAAQLAGFMQDLMGDFGDISVEKVKIHMNLKTEFLENKGEELADSLISLATSVSMQQKQYIPLFMNVIISDEVFED